MLSAAEILYQKKTAHYCSYYFVNFQETASKDARKKLQEIRVSRLKELLLT